MGSSWAFIGTFAARGKALEKVRAALRAQRSDDEDVRESLIVDSYRILAPKRLVKQLDAQLGKPAEKPKAKPAKAKKPAAKRKK